MNSLQTYELRLVQDALARCDGSIAMHQQLRLEEPFKSQLARLHKLTAGLFMGLHSAWLMSRRCPEIFDQFLTFRFLDDALQSAVAILTLAKEGQLSTAKREMRYLLESCAKRVYVDLEKMGKPLKEKSVFLAKEVPKSSISFVKNFRLYEFSSNENTDFMNSIRSTYFSLCRYVHRSSDQINETFRLLERGISPGFETANELRAFCRELANLYDLILVLHFNALGMSLAGDVFTNVLDWTQKWPHHKTKFVKILSTYFGYKQERQQP